MQPHSPRSTSPRYASASSSSNWSRPVSGLLVLLRLLGTLLIPAAPAAAQEVRALPQLLNHASSRPRNTFRVIVRRLNHTSPAGNTLANNGGRKLRELPGIDAFVATLPGQAIAAVGQRGAITWPTLNWSTSTEKTIQ
jgi:hypothetical protein